MASRITRRAFAAQGAILLAGCSSAGTAARRLPDAPPTANASAAPRAAPIAGDAIPAWMAMAGVPGLAQASIGSRAAPIVPHVGTADAARNTPVDARTVFEAASLSKPIVAYLTLLLVDRGRLDLDAPLGDLLGENPVPADSRGARITVRHVLSHSSGLQNWRFRSGDTLALAFDPGAKFGYSGEGFVLLQRALERITGIPFARLMRQELFAPLGLRLTSFAWLPELASLAARPHDRRGTPQDSFAQKLGRELAEYAGRQEPAVTVEDLAYEGLVRAAQALAPERPPFPNFFAPNAAASLLTSAAEYATLMTLLLDEATPPRAIRLSDRSRRAMRTPQVALAPSLSWGLGIGIEAHARGPLLWHWGDNGGFKNFVVVQPDARRGRVIFTNGSGGLRLAERLLRAEYGDLGAFLWV